jgi:hypothetical protein
MLTSLRPVIGDTAWHVLAAGLDTEGGHVANLGAGSLGRISEMSIRRSRAAFYGSMAVSCRKCAHQPWMSEYIARVGLPVYMTVSKHSGRSSRLSSSNNKPEAMRRSAHEASRSREDSYVSTDSFRGAEAGYSCNPMKVVPHKVQARTNTNQPYPKKKIFGTVILPLAG